MGGKVGRRLGQHLAVHLDLGRHGEAGEWRAGAELRHTGGFGPGQRAAKLAVAAEQFHRHQWIGFAERLFRGAWAGEADQKSALLHPFGQRVALGTRRQRPIGQDQHRQVALQQGRQIGLADLGVRLQRAMQIIERSGKGGVGGREVAGEHADWPPAPAFVEQHHGGSRRRPFQHQPAKPVAQFWRQHDRGAGLACTGRQIQRCTGQGAAIAALRQHHGLVGEGMRRLGDPRHQSVSLVFRRQQETGRRRLTAQLGHLAYLAQRRGELREIGTMCQPVAQIGHRSAGLVPGQQRFCRGRTIWGPGFRVQRGDTRAQIGHRERRGGLRGGSRAVRCGGQQCHLPPGAFGAIQNGVGCLHASRPVAGRCPAIVHHQQHWARTGQR